jgi:hypothetical protein
MPVCRLRASVMPLWEHDTSIGYACAADRQVHLDVCIPRGFARRYENEDDIRLLMAVSSALQGQSVARLLRNSGISAFR